MRFIDCFRPPARAIDAECLQIADRVLRMGPREEVMVAAITRHIPKNPAAMGRRPVGAVAM
jgi:hypothetical protein